MHNPVEKLDKLFKDFIGLKDATRFFYGLTKYFRFIEDTYPLNNIAYSIFSATSSPSILSNIKGLYEHVVFNRSGGNNFAGINPSSPGGSGIFMFHSLLIENAKKTGLAIKKTIVLHSTAGDQRICLAGNNNLCYAIRGKSLKDKLPQRFKIVGILARVRGGKSAREIAELLNKDASSKTIQDNIKKEIMAINKNFREKLEVDDDLIVSDESRVKNIFTLNRNSFNFSIEK